MSNAPPDPAPMPDYRGALRSQPSIEAPIPLTPEQRAEIERGKLRGKKIRRAVSVAYSDAWISAIFAGCGILMGCFGIENLIIGLAMGFIAYNSFRGAAGLKRLDLLAPGKLALNQLMLASFLTAYFAYQLWGIAHGKSSLASALGSSSDFKDLGSGGESMVQVQDMVVKILYAAYSSLIVATVVTQGLTALYYNSRKKLISDYLEQTPPWVVDMLKTQP